MISAASLVLTFKDTVDDIHCYECVNISGAVCIYASPDPKSKDPEPAVQHQTWKKMKHLLRLRVSCGTVQFLAEFV